MKEKQGVFLAVELTDRKLCVKLLSLIPISWVHLDRVDYLRVSNFSEHLAYMRRGIKSQYWPTFFRGYKRRTTPVYMLKIDNGKRRIFVRLQSSLHYRLRNAIGRNHKSRKRPPAPW